MWAAFIGPIAALGAFTFFGLMCFPSVRSAVIERFRQRTLRHADAAAIVAQIAQLRGEVYALRGELAQATRGVAAGNGAVPVSSAPPQARIGG